jgi:hypothetical protein
MPAAVRADPSDPPAGFPRASAADWLVQARITRHCRTPLERDLSKLIRPCSASATYIGSAEERVSGGQARAGRRDEKVRGELDSALTWLRAPTLRAFIGIERVGDVGMPLQRLGQLPCAGDRHA